MYLAKFVTAMAALAISFAMASALPVLEKRGSGGGVCTSSYFAPVTTVGNQAGTPFCESQWGTGYLPITTINTWSDSSYVLGIQVIYSDGSQSPIYGSTTDLNELSISVSYASDNITILDLYQDAGYPYLNALYVSTASGKIMNAGEPVYYFPTEYTQAVGSGILFGVSGTIDPSSGYLFSLGFEFLNGTIESIDVTNFQFSNLPADDEDITPTTIDTGTWINNETSGELDWSFSGSNSTTYTYTYGLSFTESFTPSEAIKFGFDGAIPGVTGDSTTTFQWELESMQSFTYAYSSTQDFMWGVSGKLQPGQSVSCVAAYGRGIGNFPFNSTVTVNLQDGNSFSFEESGILQVDDASNIEVECSNNNTQ